MNIQFEREFERERVRKWSKLFSVALLVVMVAICADYLASVGCLIVAPDAPIIGQTRHEYLHGGSSEVYTSVGTPRVFLEPSGEGHSLVLKIGESHAAWQNPNLIVSIVYFIYLTFFASVILKGLNHLRKLFSYFSKGSIFTNDTVAEISRFGESLLLLAGVEFLGCIIVIVVARMLREPMVSSIEFPLDLIFAGFLIRLVAGIFAEGQRLNEDSALTI